MAPEWTRKVATQPAGEAEAEALSEEELFPVIFLMSHILTLPSSAPVATKWSFGYNV